MPFRFGFRGNKVKEAGDEKLLPAKDGREQHQREREQFKSVLQTFGATRIKERLLILDIFLSMEEHLAISALEKLVRERSAVDIERDFLVETMKMFCQFGFAQERSFAASETLYEHLHLGTHHDHFICIRCGKIQEFVNPDIERLQTIMARDYQFHPLQHKMEIYGLCASCMAKRAATLPLHLAANGERVRIVSVGCAREEQKRLADMGLIPGSCIEIINNQTTGPFIVALKETRLAIHADIAERIMVSHSCHYDEL